MSNQRIAIQNWIAALQRMRDASGHVRLADDSRSEALVAEAAVAEEAMTATELADHERHANSVDSRMSERVLELVAEVRRLNTDLGQLRLDYDDLMSRVDYWMRLAAQKSEPAVEPGRSRDD